MRTFEGIVQELSGQSWAVRRGCVEGMDRSELESLSQIALTLVDRRDCHHALLLCIDVLAAAPELDLVQPIVGRLMLLEPPLKKATIGALVRVGERQPLLAKKIAVALANHPQRSCRMEGFKLAAAAKISGLEGLLRGRYR